MWRLILRHEILGNTLDMQREIVSPELFLNTSVSVRSGRDGIGFSDMVVLFFFGLSVSLATTEISHASERNAVPL